MEQLDRLWIEGKFLCHDCLQEIDDSRLVKTVSGHEVCELCTVKCFICDELQSGKEVTVFNGDNICDACREHLFVIYDSLHKAYLASHYTRMGSVVEWSADKEFIRIFDSRIEAQGIINLFLSGNSRYQIQKL